MAFEALLRLFGGNHLKELLLARRGANRGKQLALGA